MCQSIIFWQTKRYAGICVYDNKIHITVAGVPKSKGAKCYEKLVREILKNNEEYKILSGAILFKEEKINELLNNPGITGASFNIVYDERLTFVGYENGNVLNASTISINAFSGKNIIGVTLGRAEVDYSSGNLLKLIFEVPENSQLSHVYNIDLTYSMSGDKFSDAQSKPIDIITIGGKITVVDHLPGDVNDDGVIDAVDVVLSISKYLGENPTMNLLAADVVKDGIIDSQDVVGIQNLFLKSNLNLYSIKRKQ